MEVLREASRLEKTCIASQSELSFFFTLADQFTEGAFLHALTLVMRRHPLLSAKLNDTVFIQLDTIEPSGYITFVESLEAPFILPLSQLDGNGLFHLFCCLKENGMDCVLVLHTVIGDVTSGVALIEDLCRGLLMPHVPQNKLPCHYPIDTFFPYTPHSDEISSYARQYHDQHVHPATCRFLIENPELPFEQLEFKRKSVRIRADRMSTLRAFAKEHSVSKHALFAACLVHALTPAEDKKSACIVTAVDMKRRLIEDAGYKDVFSGVVYTTSFFDVDGRDPQYVTAKKYAGVLAAKIESADLYKEAYALSEGEINLFSIGSCFALSDGGIIRFSDGSVAELVSDISFVSTYPEMNAPHLSFSLYEDVATLHIVYPHPWIPESEINSFLSYLERQIVEFH